MPALIAILAAAFAWILWRFGRRPSTPGRSLIISPAESTVIASDGGVRSEQSALLTLPTNELERLWIPANLENLGRTYWRFLTRVTLGVIRIRYTETSREVVLLFRPLVLLRFDLPEFVLEPDHGKISWRIRDGLLVAKAGRNKTGGLSLDVRRTGTLSETPGTGEPVSGTTGPDTGQQTLSVLRIEVAVANFYPSIASWLGTLVYEGTQAFIHVLVTHAFLRSLARLELDESKVGRLREPAQP